jgi:phospholipase D1/2
VVYIPHRSIFLRKHLFQGMLLLGLLGLAAAWHWTPLSAWLAPEALADWAQSLGAHPWGGAAVIGSFVLGSLLVVPLSAMIVATALIFGPLLGFVYALTGALSAALATYALGYLVGGGGVRRWAQSRNNLFSERLSTPKQRLLAVIFIRVVPLAPFTVVNLAAGASRISIHAYMLGSLLGMAPGILAMVFFADGLLAAWRNPNTGNFACILLLGLLAFGIAAFSRLWPGAKNKQES